MIIYCWAINHLNLVYITETLVYGNIIPERVDLQISFCMIIILYGNALFNHLTWKIKYFFSMYIFYTCKNCFQYKHSSCLLWMMGFLIHHFFFYSCITYLIFSSSKKMNKCKIQILISFGFSDFVLQKNRNWIQRSTLIEFPILLLYCNRDQIIFQKWKSKENFKLNFSSLWNINA